MSFLSFYIDSLMMVIWNDNPSNVYVLYYPCFYFNIKASVSNKLQFQFLRHLQVFCVKTWESDKTCTVQSVFNENSLLLGLVLFWHNLNGECFAYSWSTIPQCWEKWRILIIMIMKIVCLKINGIFEMYWRVQKWQVSEFHNGVQLSYWKKLHEFGTLHHIFCCMQRKK